MGDRDHGRGRLRGSDERAAVAPRAPSSRHAVTTVASTAIAISERARSGAVDGSRYRYAVQCAPRPSPLRSVW